jgi:hypothetical protein
MQSLGPDLMDLVFRMKRSLAVRITRESVVRLRKGVHYGQESEFRKFAAAVVGESRDALSVKIVTLPSSGPAARASDLGG